MKLTYDKQADAAYVYIKDKIKAGEAARTLCATESINLDFDKQGKLLGVEILDASKMLDKGILKDKSVVMLNVLSRNCFTSRNYFTLRSSSQICFGVLYNRLICGRSSL